MTVKEKKVVILADLKMKKGIEIAFMIEQKKDQSNDARPKPNNSK